MKYDFLSVPDRTGCGSTKWDEAQNASTENVPLSVADMEFYPAPAIANALAETAKTKILGYTKPTAEYFDAVCSWMKRRHNFDVKKEWIINTPGVVDALAVLIDAMTQKGDSILICTPVYYPFDMAALAKSRHIVYSTLKNENNYYTVDFDDLEKKAKSPDVKVLLFCNPHNPVGRVWTKEELERVGNICCDNGVFIIDDEIHNDLIMPGYEHTVMATINERIKENIAVCTAPSKTFNLAGLQCSNIIIPNPLARLKASACSMLNMQNMLNIFAYPACIAAYNESEDWLEELITVIADNEKLIRDFMAEKFPEIIVHPLEGTYLLWLDMRELGLTYVELREMLIKAGIYLDYGEMFGSAARGFERINLACSPVTIKKMLTKFEKAVAEVRADWAVNGKPYHKTLSVGDKLLHFKYDSAYGWGRELASVIKRHTLIFFASNLDNDICKKALDVFKTSYGLFRFIGVEIKVVVQSDIQAVRKAQKKYPFELISDPTAKLYDYYNVFEADSIVSMFAGDKTFEKMINGDIKSLLNSDMLASFAGALEPEETNKQGPREKQLFALIGVDSDMNVIYSHYCKTIGDLPQAKELLNKMR